MACEAFRPALERVWRKLDLVHKSRAGRKSVDAVRMFKTLILGVFCNPSDDQIAYQIRGRLSFMYDPAGDCPDLPRGGISINRATSLAVVRVWMLPSFRCCATTTHVTRTWRLKRAKCPKAGQISPRNGCKRAWTRAGQKNASRVIMATKAM
ncbi:MAG: hypothetical protein ACI9ND_002974 [Yoonia sp.]